jgi:hypothetical protein
MTKSIVDVIGRERANQLMERAVLDAIAENRRLGLPEATKADRKDASEALETNTTALVATAAPAAKKSVRIA